MNFQDSRALQLASQDLEFAYQTMEMTPTLQPVSMHQQFMLLAATSLVNCSEFQDAQNIMFLFDVADTQCHALLDLYYHAAVVVACQLFMQQLVDFAR